MCTETLLFGSNTVIDFSTNIETEIKGKIEYVLSQVHLLFVLLKYNHRFSFTLNDLYSSLKITLISVLLIFVYQIHTIFFRFFPVLF